GVRAAIGRTLTWEETWQGSDAVVLGDGVWRTHFGADPGIVDRTITLGSREVRVVGVMPAGFSFPNDETQLWMPWGWDPASYEQVFFRRAHWVRPIARLAPGVTLEQADAEYQAVVAQLQREFPETNRVMGAGMMPVRDFLIRDVRRPLLTLLGAVGLLLLLACANVANLTLVRASGRGHEVAVRHALGAGRGRIAAQMMTESVVLALAGGVLGLGVGWAGVQGMQRLTPLGIEGATALAIDLRVLLFTFAVAAASGVVFGVAPSLRTMHLRSALADEGRSGTRSRRGARTANALVAAEVALALLLVAAAGLMIQSFRNMRSVDPGFRTDGVVAVQFTVPGSRYPGRDEVVSFYDRLAASLEGRGGIERAGLVGQLPLNGTSWSSQFQAYGWPPDRVGYEIVHRRADAGYFEALEIPLIRGRMFDGTDRPDGPFVVLVNETFASTHFPGEDPIGQRIAYDRAANDSSTWYEIIGIVGDQRQVSTTQPTRAEVFENRSQDWARTNWVVVRTAGSAIDAVPTIRAALREIDPLIPVAEARTLGDVRRESMAREQFILALLATFGGAALLLATVGVYAVAAQTARTRTREIGIRMALGAEGGSIVALMLRQAFVVIGLGLSAGVLASLLATRTLRTLLFGVEPTDPATLAAVFLLLAAVAGLAVWIPARRATRMDPTGVLRDG
ncbi:MAG TPA: ADOP family duplicated permease, partial [Longimicrobiales bacterium]|nr:ADOP family duplicated permease [Longimicrobiales bacterium]